MRTLRYNEIFQIVYQTMIRLRPDISEEYQLSQGIAVAINKHLREIDEENRMDAWGDAFDRGE